MVESHDLSVLAADFLAGLNVERRTKLVEAIAREFLDRGRVANILPVLYTLEKHELPALVFLIFGVMSWWKGVSIPMVDIQKPDSPQAIESPSRPAQVAPIYPEPVVNKFVYKKPEVKIDPETGIAKIEVQGKNVQ